MSLGFELVVIGMMLLFNAIFAAYEMALASVSRSRLSLLLYEKRRGAEAAVFMKDRLEASLAVVQVGITLAGAIAAATGGAGMEETLSPYLEKTWHVSERLADALAIAFLVVPLSCLTIVFAELVPKVFALRNKELVCLKLSPSMKVLCL
jgi:putative hemolysin